MTVTRVPASNPEPEFQPEGGLDGNGTMHAADLPQHTGIWGWTQHPAHITTYDPDEPDAPVTRKHCLHVQPGYATLPGRCKKPDGHAGEHDYNETNDAKLIDRRRRELDEPMTDIAGVSVNVWEAEGGAA